jgi:methionyl-tRNA formyltransferase
MAVTTPEGRLVLESVQPAGGRPMTGQEFLRGRPSLADSELVAPAHEGGR